MTVLRSGRVIEKENRVEEEREELREEEEGIIDEPNKEESLRKETGEEPSKDEPPKVPLPAPLPTKIKENYTRR